MKLSIRASITLVMLALLLAACLPTAPTQQEQPQIQGTPQQSAQDVQSSIETAVAQTVEAQNQIGTSVAETMTAQPTATATATLLALPTLTPFDISTPTRVPSVSGGGSTTTPDYMCDVIRVRPYDNTEFLHGQDFDIKWTILNTGKKVWPAGYDLKYYSGPLMTNAGTVQLPEMDPKDQFSVVFDAKAPDEPGFHVMTWVVEGKLCFPYVAIYVRR
ncbi:MAG: hypothetical protein HYZ23_06765 [Chloroflexi bacterium]|nr:hypothetical protein [Chloroflexota bacterium]